MKHSPQFYTQPEEISANSLRAHLRSKRSLSFIKSGIPKGTDLGCPISFEALCRPITLGRQLYVPPLVADLISHIENNGLDHPNLYRRSNDLTSRPNYSSMFETLLDSGPRSFDCKSASLLTRKMLKIVREPFIDLETQAVLCRTLDAWDCGAVNDLVSSVRKSISDSTVNRCLKDTLALMCCHLRHVHLSNRHSKPDSLNQLVECFTGVFRVREKIMKFLITNSDEIFGKIEFIQTTEEQTDDQTESLSDFDVSFYRQELERKDSLLSMLITEASKDVDAHKDEMLWTLQREITQIKRKLKGVNVICQSLDKGEKEGNTINSQVDVKQEPQGLATVPVASKSVLLGEHMLSNLRGVRDEIAANLKTIRSLEMKYDIIPENTSDHEIKLTVEELSTKLAKLLVENESLESQLDEVKERIEREQMAIDHCMVELKWRSPSNSHPSAFQPSTS